jgi:hypothetical protein
VYEALGYLLLVYEALSYLLEGHSIGALLVYAALSY